MPLTTDLVQARSWMDTETTNALRDMILAHRDEAAGFGGINTLYPQAFTAEEQAVADRAAERIAAFMSDAFSEPLSVECWILSSMRDGAEHTPHADAELADGSPNHTPQRSHVGLLYLSTEGLDHSGGILHVADEVYPSQRGLLVCFPSTKDYWHWVTPVTSGDRLALAVWTKR